MALKTFTGWIAGAWRTFRNDAYDPSTNPYGMASGGHHENLFDALEAVSNRGVLLGTWSSTSSVLTGTGAKVFAAESATLATLLAQFAGKVLYRITTDDQADVVMTGTIASVDGVNVTMTVTGSVGTPGTYGNWTIALSGEQGSEGQPGNDGADAPTDELDAANGKIDQTITTGTVAMNANRRSRITGGTGTLPTLTAENFFAIVELAPADGVTATVGRNSQTLDGEATDDTYTGDGGPGPVIRYTFVSAGVVRSQLIGSTQ